jgi:hypothetical protein
MSRGEDFWGEIVTVPLASPKPLRLCLYLPPFSRVMTGNREEGLDILPISRVFQLDLLHWYGMRHRRNSNGYPTFSDMVSMMPDVWRQPSTTENSKAVSKPEVVITHERNEISVNFNGYIYIALHLRHAN